MPKRKSDLSKKTANQLVNMGNSSSKKVKKGSGKSTRSKKQNEAALRNLAKARQAKKAYDELRKQGFNRENIGEATDIIQQQLSRLSSFHPENNPAVAQLLEEVGGNLPTQAQISAMSNSEYYTYATSLRSFLGSPLSSEKGINQLTNRLVSEIIGENLMRKKGERRNSYFERRKQFISENAETAKQAFRLYRQLESTHAGLILRGKISPEAYGSDNLIVDLFDFVENDYDGDFDAARAYWEEQLENQYQWEEQERANFKGKKISKFDWEGRESYESFVRRKTKGY